MMASNSNTSNGASGGGKAQDEMAVKFVDDAPSSFEGSNGIAGGSSGSAAAAPSGGVLGFGRHFGSIQEYYASLVEYKNQQFRYLRPWNQFFEYTKFSAPGKLEVISRVSRNVGYYYVNYVILACLCSLYVLLINPMFLITMGLTALMLAIIRSRNSSEQPISIGGRTVGFMQAYVFVAVFGLTCFFFTNGSSTLFWLVLTSAVVVFAHAAAREPTYDEEHGQQQFSFV